ncbi:hypothetical protein GRFL_2158 [Christiangramia flava JLT2011]|uniref:Por secretion system C-terminal sorting domain-containing protein n=2 Tax=Christiangramia TaxID=292691 RepID=A0A1L7I6Z5_9FLAO|nr:hypothetical protein GRFL_2158 [Christiangramia flava JLT2011]
MKQLQFLALLLFLGIWQGHSQNLPDVWDFGATQLDASSYDNQLDVDAINAWYDSSIAPGTTGINLPDFVAGDLTWTGGGNDRLRTSNTALTRYDENISDYEDFKGRIYINSSGATGRFFSLELQEDDEVTLWATTQNGTGQLHFEYAADPEMQNDVIPVTKELTELNFVAKTAGTYRIYDDTDKPSYFRIIRKAAEYSAVSGSVDLTGASGIPDGYSLNFTNEAGKTWSASVSGGTYSLNLLIGEQYQLSLEGAEGYSITSATSLEVTESSTSFDVTIQKDGGASSSGLADVWDFGATQLDASEYNNQLDVDAINAWYDSSIAPGTTGINLPDFVAGDLTWTGGGNDRLRTSNTALTRYDENISDYEDFKGRIYINSSGATGRFFSLELQEDDEVTLWATTQNGTGQLHFEYAADPEMQNDVIPVTKELTELIFVAKAAGTYRIYDDTDKPSYFRIIRKAAEYSAVSGSVDLTAASGIPDGYSLNFTNEAGKTWSASVSGGTYSLNLPIGEQYQLSLEGAEGYSITSATSLEITESSTSFDVTIQKDGGASSSGLADVWDFGATQLDASEYNNQLDVDAINAWYDSSIAPGTTGINLPDFAAGDLTWTGGGNDRLRTSNTALTRYDENISDYEDFKGRIYINSSGATGRFFSLELEEDDEVTFWALSQNGNGKLHFEYAADPEMQNDVIAVGAEITEVHVVAKAAGTYRIYDDTDKPSYFRFIRKAASYVTLTGAVDLAGATGIPADYQIVFTNEAGKSWSWTADGENYSVQLPAGYTYELSLENANGYIISNGSSLEVNAGTTSYDIAIQKVELYEVSGAITGLGDALSELASLDFVPDPEANSIYVPEPMVDLDAGTYSVQLEANMAYTIEGEGVNDYFIPENTVEITANTSRDIEFEKKPLQDVSIVANGLTDAQKSDLVLTFTNLNEPDYTYTFSDINTIALRDGVYEISLSGLDQYPLQLAPTSNLVLDGVAVFKSLDFEQVMNWSFDDMDITTDTEYYKGLMFTGNIKNEKAKGHLAAGSGGTISVPMQPGQKMVVTYYYAADFSIDGGDAITTSSGSTSQLETTTYEYPGTEAGTAVITINATSYITNIEIIDVVAYAAEITVGEDKDYQTINGALDAISRMDRPNSERVTVLIDPGNYEEMLVINQDNVTLKNAALIPSIELTNQGVDIASNAVRVTSYYGYGYNYYSQGTDNKWNADILAVNKANGSQPYNNVSGTTNASYWNATVVVSADGFIAEDLIIENSFNQYISKKESEDVLVLVSGNKGERPTDYGNTSVQDRSFVERAAAIGIASGSDKVILDKCRIVGRQDSFYGGSDTRVVVYKGAMMGAVDYIFGGMTAVFYKTDLVMNTSDVSSDAAYLTAAQQSEGRGFLMYECNIISTEPGVNTASTYGAKPGFFGRPWQANTSEVVFFQTTIDTSSYPGFEGKSLIDPEGWRSTLGGESEKMYEYGTIELSGVDHSADRVAWATVLETPVLKDDTEITTFNFTKGNDGWDPLPQMESTDDTDHDGILDVDDNCVSTPNPDQADMDGDGIGDVCDDSDGDGLVDAEDSCPNSPEGAIVDVFGCEVFDLAADNYTITVHDVSCNGNSDAYISITAMDTNYTYNVAVSGDGNGSATLSEANAFSANVENLSAGNYEVCITVDSNDTYEQCFRVSIDGPTPISAYSSVDYGANTVTFNLTGSSNYTIEHNGKISTTQQSQVTLDLQKGRNSIRIHTDSDCQGEIFKEVLLSEEVVLFPNPTRGDLKVYINGEDSRIDLKLMDINGNVKISRKMDVPEDRVIDLDLTDYRNGVYFLMLNSETVSKSLKIIKS